MKIILRAIIIIVATVAIATIILLTFMNLLSFLINDRTALYINWGIDIPKAEKIDVIYNYNGRDGEDFEIWYYTKEGMKKIINNNKFNQIKQKDKVFVQQQMEEYYSLLDSNEKGLFDNTNIDINDLLAEDNYFTFQKKESNESTWLLLILDSKSNKLYYFSNVY